MYFSRLPRSQTLYSSSSSFHKRILSTEFVDGTKQWTPSIINQALWHQIRCSKESIPSSVLKKERRKTFHHLGCFSQFKLWAAVCVLSFFFSFTLRRFQEGPPLVRRTGAPLLPRLGAGWKRAYPLKRSQEEKTTTAFFTLFYSLLIVGSSVKKYQNAIARRILNW